MKNKFNLDLRFLYQKPLDRNYVVGGGHDTEWFEWRQKYETQEILFEKFITRCDIDDFLYLFIYVFRETFPNTNRLAFSICNDYTRENVEQRVYLDYKRRDILKFTHYLHHDVIEDELFPEARDVFVIKIAIKFKNVFSHSVVDEALKGLEYTKELIEDITVYNIKDSPLQKLEITSNSIILFLNKDKAILYYKR